MKKKPLRDELAELFAAFGGQQNNLVIPRPYLRLCDNDHRAALLLSQCIYWSDRCDDPQHWVAKSYADWFDELGMSEYEVRRATKVLRPLGLETKLRHSRHYQGAPTLHYRIDKAKLSECILKKLQNGTLTNSRMEPEETSDSLTETTAETTAEEINAPLGAPILNAGAQNGDDSFMTILLPANHPVFDEPERIAKYPCVPADVNALITAWWNWVPVRPSKRGKVIPAKAHYANTENRAYARSLVERGVLPSDFALLLGDIRSNPDSRWAHLKGKELTFCYVAPIVEEWVREDREENWYTEVQPRVTPMRPDVVIRLGDIEDGQALERLNHHPDCYIDVPKPYLSPQDVATEEDDESFDPDTATDAELLASFGEPL